MLIGDGHGGREWPKTAFWRSVKFLVINYVLSELACDSIGLHLRGTLSGNVRKAAKQPLSSLCLLVTDTEGENGRKPRFGHSVKFLMINYGVSELACDSIGLHLPGTLSSHVRKAAKQPLSSLCLLVTDTEGENGRKPRFGHTVKL